MLQLLQQRLQALPLIYSILFSGQGIFLRGCLIPVIIIAACPGPQARLTGNETCQRLAQHICTAYRQCQSEMARIITSGSTVSTKETICSMPAASALDIAGAMGLASFACRTVRLLFGCGCASTLSGSMPLTCTFHHSSALTAMINPFMLPHGTAHSLHDLTCALLLVDSMSTSWVAALRAADRVAPCTVHLRGVAGVLTASGVGGPAHQLESHAALECACLYCTW